MEINKPLVLNNLKILLLYIIGYIISSHYRPLKYSLGFYDFGLADSGLGLLHVSLTYFILTPPFLNQAQAERILIFIRLSRSRSILLLFPWFCWDF